MKGGEEMNYSTLVNKLSSLVVQNIGQKAQTGDSHSAFNNILESEKTKTVKDSFLSQRSNNFVRNDQTKRQGLRNNERVVEKPRDKAQHESTNYKHNEVKKNEDTNIKDKKIANNEIQIKKDENVISNEKQELANKEEVKELTQEQKELLDKLAQTLGISMESLHNILKFNSISINQLTDSKVNVIAEELATLIDQGSTNKGQILKEIRDLLKELKEKGTKIASPIQHTTNVDENKVADVVTGTKNEKQVLNADNGQISGKSQKESNIADKEELGQQEDKSKKVTGVKQVESENKNAGEVSKEGKKVNSTEIKDTAVGAENEKTGEKAEKALRAEKDNSEESDSGSSQSETKGDKVKVVATKTDKVEAEFKVNNENANQTPKNINDIKEIKHILKDTNILHTSKEEILKQVIDKAAVLIGQDKAEMVMNLKPDHLGKLTLKVVTENGMVTAQMIAENQQVKQIIESNFNVLRDSLEKQGIVVQQFSVSVGQDSWNKGFNQDSQRNSSKNSKGNQNISGINVSGNYTGGREELKSHLWPDSTVSFTA